ncbi:hypothetical protein D1AOALGA4SA_11870 [Olavius algarvensis Delta 1 endosymbiont]|nr:hypothetical protein D1AOALGA4SA_11870 [Olavius algarvensis Delta 1 endosymbiont]
MINLRTIYGNKVFDRKKAYKNSRYALIVNAIIFDIVFTFLFVKIFDVNWDYAYIKVWAILCALSIEPAHKLKIDQNKLQNCRSNILNLVNVL